MQNTQIAFRFESVEFFFFCPWFLIFIAGACFILQPPNRLEIETMCGQNGAIRFYGYIANDWSSDRVIHQSENETPKNRIKCSCVQIISIWASSVESK